MNAGMQGLITLREEVRRRAATLTDAIFEATQCVGTDIAPDFIEGVLDGAMSFLIRTQGPARTYEILQRRADDVAPVDGEGDVLAGLARLIGESDPFKK